MAGHRDAEAMPSCHEAIVEPAACDLQATNDGASPGTVLRALGARWGGRFRRVRVRPDTARSHDLGPLVALDDEGRATALRNGPMTAPSGVADTPAKRTFMFYAIPQHAGGRPWWERANRTAIRQWIALFGLAVLRSWGFGLAFLSAAVLIGRSPGSMEVILSIGVAIGGVGGALLATLCLATLKSRISLQHAVASQAGLVEELVAMPPSALRPRGIEAVLTELHEHADICQRQSRLNLKGPVNIAALIASLALLAAAVPAAAVWTSLAASLTFLASRRLDRMAASREQLAANAERRGRNAVAALCRALPEARLGSADRWLNSRALAARQEAISMRSRAALRTASWHLIQAPAACIAILIELWLVGNGRAFGEATAACLLSFVCLRAAGHGGAMSPGVAAESVRHKRSAIQTSAHDPVRGAPPFHGIVHLALDRVSFAYATGEPPVLRDIDLELRRGEVIGLGGASGSGKTTLVRLLLGIELPTTGRVLVNGRNLQDHDLKSVQARMALVRQDEIVQATTLRQLLVGQSVLHPSDLRHALELTDIAGVIAGMPMGMQTLVSDRTVPSGPIGRLMVARALARRPDILALDEALAAFSLTDQARLFDRLRAARMGVVLVSHHLETLELADRMMIL